MVPSEETIELESGEINRISCRLAQGQRSQSPNTLHPLRWMEFCKSSMQQGRFTSHSKNKKNKMSPLHPSKISKEEKALRGKSIDASLSPVKRFPQIKKEGARRRKKIYI